MSRTELNEEEKRILKKLSEALPNMREREKYYILGMAECMAGNRKESRELACIEAG